MAETTKHIFPNIFNTCPLTFVSTSLSFFKSNSNSTFLHVQSAKGVSGYTYCRRWLLINRVPSYQPTHDWPLSTKRGEKKNGRRSLRVALGNHEACVDFKKRFQANPQDIVSLCVCVGACVFKCVDLNVYRVVFCGRRDKAWETLTLMTPLNASPTPAECLLNTPILACTPLLALWGHSVKLHLQRKAWGGGVCYSCSLEMTSSRDHIVHWQNFYKVFH